MVKALPPLRTLRPIALFLLGTASLLAAEGPAFGVQVGLMVPVQGDLKVTAGSGGDFSLGLHLDFALAPSATLRTRLDLGAFSSTDRAYGYGSFQEFLHTRVTTQALGGEVLCQPGALGGNWSVGAGLYLIQWTVESTNNLVTTTGAFVPSGSSSWTRQGLGLLASRRWPHHLETEFRVVASHYGYQNLPARWAEVNLLWNF